MSKLVGLLIVENVIQGDNVFVRLDITHYAPVIAQYAQELGKLKPYSNRNSDEFLASGFVTKELAKFLNLKEHNLNDLVSIISERFPSLVIEDEVRYAEIDFGIYNENYEYTIIKVTKE